MLFLGIDLGTSSVKVIAMDEKNQIIGEASETYPLFFPKEGWAEQNPEDWWHGTLNALKSLLAQPQINAAEVRGIGFSGQMHGLVSLDASNNVLHPALLWCDQRTDQECETLTNDYGLTKLRDTVANQALTGFTAPKILWIKNNHPELFKQIQHILLPKDYIRFKLSGAYATDYSDASGMLLLDIENKCWSKEMCQFLGLDMNVLPKLYHSYEVTGVVSEYLCELLGFEGDVVLVGGAGDQAAGAVGTGTVKAGVISVTLGTSGVVFAAHDAFKVDDEMRLHAFCHANGKYHSMGVMLSAASTLKWWAENIHPDTPLEILLAEAELAPLGSQNVFFLPYLLGERTPYADPNARGTFVG
ncbi:MAG: xylulokinase, partial [Spirochaetes bacterium]|nr:xylulokinase [Spirochaetota bacterium]